jgi:hypothetical protein
MRGSAISEFAQRILHAARAAILPRVPITGPQALRVKQPTFNRLNGEHYPGGPCFE